MPAALLGAEFCLNQGNNMGFSVSHLETLPWMLLPVVCQAMFLQPSFRPFLLLELTTCTVPTCPRPILSDCLGICVSSNAVSSGPS